MPWKSKDWSGKKFRKWTVLYQNPDKSKKRHWFCRCDCGNEHSLSISNVSTGKSAQCKTCADFRRSNKFIGLRIGNQTCTGNIKVNGKVHLKLRCACGDERNVRPSRALLSNTCGKCVNLKYVPGRKAGMLSILSKNEDGTFNVICDCGNSKIVHLHHLKIQKPSCGCYWKKIHKDIAKKLVGIKIGRLKVVQFIGFSNPPKPRAMYKLKCKCGEIIYKSISHLYAAQSCGCLQKESIARGSMNQNSKLTENEVGAMKDLYSSGLYTKIDIAKMFNASETNVGRILKKETWRHVK